MTIQTPEHDAVLWYNVGDFGLAGYAVPNWSDDVASLNPNIIDLTNLIGANLFAIMHNEDCDLATPPSINTLRRIHRLYVRCGQVLNGRAVAPGEMNMETPHNSPAGEVFRVYPVPYFKVRNPYMRRWAGYIMMSLADAMQHTENRKTVEISTIFAGDVGQYLTRVYQNMAVEMFGKTREDVMKDGFLLTEQDLAGYSPYTFFTRTEMVDPVSRLDRVFTEDKVSHLREGIPVTQLPKLGPWPNNIPEYYRAIRTDATIATDGTSSSATAAGVSSSSGAPIIPPVTPH